MNKSALAALADDFGRCQFCFGLWFLPFQANEHYEKRSGNFGPKKPSKISEKMAVFLDEIQDIKIGPTLWETMKVHVPSEGATTVRVVINFTNTQKKYSLTYLSNLLLL